MSLDFDLSKIPGHQNLWTGENGGLNPVTNAIVLTTMAIGIGEITEHNVVEFYTRSLVCDQVYGPMFYQWDDETNGYVDRSVTLAEIRAHIGLTTNVFPKETAAKFSRRMADALMRNAGRKAEMEAREAVEAKPTAEVTAA